MEVTKNLPDGVLMICDGMVASAPMAGEKGVGMKVIIKNLGDTYRIYIPADRVNGEQLLKMYDPVKIHYSGQYASNNEIRVNAKNVFLDNGNGKKSNS